MGSSSGRPLQPLRIPQGWEVVYNQFFDVEPEVKTFDDASWDFGEDILLLTNEDRSVMIDLGWYPSHRSTGRFGMRAVSVYDEDGNIGDWEKPLRELRTRSKRKLVNTLEEWLDWYSNREPAAESQKRARRRRKKQVNTR